MKDTKEHNDQFLEEAIKEIYEHPSLPPRSKADTWAEIEKEFIHGQRTAPNSFKRRKLKWIGIAASVILMLTLTMFSQTQYGNAFGWFSKVLFGVEGNQAHLSGSIGEPSPMNKNAPPPPEIYAIETEIREETLSLEEAQKVTSFEILVPSEIPEPFTLRHVKVRFINDRTDEVILQYEGGKETFTIQEIMVEKQMGYGMGFDVEDTKIEDVMINGKKGVLLIFKDGSKKLIWDRMNYHLRLDGHLSDQEMIDIAISM